MSSPTSKLMQLSQITVSLDLARELAANGYPQESLFYWKVDHKTTEPPITRLGELGNEAPNTETFAAPTTSELGEMLPNYISDTPDGFYLHIAKWHEEMGKNPYQCFYSPAKGNSKRAFENLFEISGETIADVLAKMWLYLKKHNLLKD